MSGKEEELGKAAAAAALEGVFAALDDPDQCQFFLEGRHDVWPAALKRNAAPTHIPGQSSHSMLAVIGNLEGRLPAQLTAAACLMRMCLAEILQKEEPNPQGAKNDVGPHCLAVLTGSRYGDVVSVMRNALQVLYLP